MPSLAQVWTHMHTQCVIWAICCYSKIFWHMLRYVDGGHNLMKTWQWRVWSITTFKEYLFMGYKKMCDQKSKSYWKNLMVLKDDQVDMTQVDSSRYGLLLILFNALLTALQDSEQKTKAITRLLTHGNHEIKSMLYFKMLILWNLLYINKTWICGNESQFRVSYYYVWIKLWSPWGEKAIPVKHSS